MNFLIKSQKVGSMIEDTLIAAQVKLLAVNSIKSQKGVTMIEYALIAGLVSVTVITAVTLIGTDLKLVFTKITNALAAIAAL